MTDLRAEMDRIARFFDDEYADYDEDLELLEAYAGRMGGPLLELGCGTGRALIPLAEAGHQITGVESSHAMIARAQQKIEWGGLGKLVRLVEGDFTETALDGPYAFAFTLMNTFLHLPHTNAQLAALQHWRDALIPGGLLLIDVFNPDVALLATMDGRLEWDRSWEQSEPPATVMKFITRVADPAEQVVTVNHIYDETAPDGALRRTVAAFELRYLWRFEAELLLDKAGFEVDAIYGDWSGNAFGSDSERMILVARKRAGHESIAQN
jgi:SAM-dependent methyltransferase